MATSPTPPPTATGTRDDHLAAIRVEIPRCEEFGDAAIEAGVRFNVSMSDDVTRDRWYAYLQALAEADGLEVRG